NGFFIPGVLLMHWALAGWAEFRISRGATGTLLQVPRIPAAFFSMILIGPVIFYLLWPRHYFDSFNRVAWYIERHLAHEHYAVHYYGELLVRPPFPREFPFVMSWYTIPMVTLFAIFIGWIAVAVHGQWRSRLEFVKARGRASLSGPLLSWPTGAVKALLGANKRPQGDTLRQDVTRQRAAV